MNSSFPYRNAERKVAALYFRSIRLVMLSIGLSLSPRLHGAESRSQSVIAGIDDAQELRAQKLTGYAAVEHYTVRNSHFRQSAELTASVVYQRALGKTYKILSRSGPGFLQECVINRILKEDAALSQSTERSRNLLTSANYSMEVQGTQRLHDTECYVVSIHPRRHKLSLIDGKAWIDIQAFSLLRIEGKPAASPSIWTGRPFIEREYRIIDGFSFPKYSRATSKEIFTGRSELEIEYSQYHIFEGQNRKVAKKRNDNWKSTR